MTDIYANWRERLANAALPKAQQKKLPTYETVVDPGFYRKPIKEKTPGGATKRTGWEPVAFWIEGEGDKRELCGVIGVGHSGRSLNAGQCEREWLSCVQYPIAEDVYRAVAERGEPWPDQHVVEPAEPAVVKPAAPLATIPPAQVDELRKEWERPGTVVAAASADVDSAAPILAEIERLRPGAAQYAKIESDEQAARGQDLRSQLTTEAGKLDRHREALVRPHLDAQQKINRTFNPIIQAAKGDADIIRRGIAEWERTKREAAAAAERERQRIERENKQEAELAAAGNEPAPTPKPLPVSNAPEPAAQIKGATGRAAAVRDVWRAHITDPEAFFATVKTDPELLARLQRLAQQKVDAGLTPPGVEKVKDVDVR